MNLEEKVEYINNLLIDLEAAFLVTALFPDQKDKVFTKHLGHSKRRWSTDIDTASLESFENGEEFIALNLNRSGIYDTLPEAFFHEFPKSGTNSGKEMAKGSRKQKVIEKDARLFFRPVENELSYQSVWLSSEENRFQNKLNSDFLNETSQDFWRTKEDVPSKYITRFNKLLPFVHKIINDYQLIARCLEYILEEKTLIEYNNGTSLRNSRGPYMDPFQLGDCILGYNSTLVAKVEGNMGRLTITIGPLKNTPITEFLENGAANKLFDCFNNYFLPMELDTELNIIPEKNKSCFVLSDEVLKSHSHLGYTTVI